MASRWPCLLACVVIGGCGSDGDTPLAIDADCQPLLAGIDCMLPYPSDFFVKPDGDAPFGKRIQIEGKAKMLTVEGVSADVHERRVFSGYSTLPEIIFTMGAPVALDSLVGLFDSPEQSRDVASATTVIAAADTGELVPHFADLDPFAEDPTRQAIVLHPLERLRESARYVVLVKGLKAPDGTVLPAPEAFARLRDGRTGMDPALDALSERFEADVFGVLDVLGADRGSLQLAWDFTTGPNQEILDDVEKIREAVSAQLDSDLPRVEIRDVTDNDRAGAWKTISGVFEAPLFLESDDVDAELARDDNLQVTMTATAAQFRFIVQVPESVRTSNAPVRVVAFGHGFFASRTELLMGAALEIANGLNAVMVSIDWLGMSAADRGQIVLDLTNEPWRSMAFNDRLQQAMANWMVMTKIIKEVLPNRPELMHPDTGMPFYDPSNVYFLGLSQGHILGGVLAAWSPDFTRIGLGVGGAGFTHMMFRAAPFAPFHTLMGYALEDPLEVQKFVATLQRPMDAIDPAFFAQYVFQHRFENTPEDRRILMQLGIGDTSVPTFSGLLHARLLEIGMTMPSPEEVWNMRESDGRSGVTLYDFGIDERALNERPEPPLAKNEVHLSLRVLPAALEQLDLFFRPDSTVVHTCDGPCDPE